MFTNFCRDFHKLLPRCSQTFAALFKNSCRDFHKLLRRCSQTFAVTFINSCRDFHKLLRRCSQTLVWLLPTFAVRAFVVMLLYHFAVTPVGHRKRTSAEESRYGLKPALLISHTSVDPLIWFVHKDFREKAHLLILDFPNRRESSV